MKKFFFLFLLFVFAISLVFGDGAYISKISADSKGLTLTSKGHIYIGATRSTIISGATSVTISASNGNVYIQSVSGAAGTNLIPMKSVVLYGNATEAGTTITLSLRSTFTDRNSYWVFLQSTAAAISTGTATNIDGSRFVLIGGQGVTYRIWALGY